MSGDFLDSNVILYMFDVDERKNGVAHQVVAQALQGDACISFQVVQEVLNVLTHEANRQATPEQAEGVLASVLVPLWRVMPSQQLYSRALGVQSRYQFRFYDSLIVAAALEAGCDRILTEDLQDGQRIESLTITNPFATSRGA
jgi:predicted nucleic acid-binding protein